MIAIYAFCALAAVLWFVIFSPWTAEHVSFWPAMVFSTGLLAAAALTAQREKLRELFAWQFRYALIGVVSAVFLYGVFFFGDIVARWMLPFAQRQIEGVYGSRQELPLWLISVFLILVIGPAEEIFWRGFVQQRLGSRWGSFAGWFAATAVYTGVHVFSLNFMLLVASAVCGGFWGLLYWRYKSLWPVIISHALWDVMIFVIWPVGAGV
ncbi:CAAX prenyl protease-related protein [Anaerohalosphaera lusitana]|uniref:CAAX prenyl protease-related protein n=1 Tax=Anaerohalosphaera lusitana TaxID=1936003 RepID=A0A1U9NIG4_9BACT|nr:type II CAAX endopeptidase family protein [Anaerohalosphaera lusitana]AQT67732.1 CAAX prenyl protease-related protein [Anaerohalosphaera lusitana]